jgi:hypothetical protein
MPADADPEASATCAAKLRCCHHEAAIILLASDDDDEQEQHADGVALGERAAHAYAWACAMSGDSKPLSRLCCCMMILSTMPIVRGSG